MQHEGKLIYQVPLPPETAHGTFFAPRAFEIERLSMLEREVFGPILHVIPYAADRLDNVISAINATGYGLTLGIHSRIDETVRYVQTRAHVGNTYVNRNMIGAPPAPGRKPWETVSVGQYQCSLVLGFRQHIERDADAHVGGLERHGPVVEI